MVNSKSSMIGGNTLGLEYTQSCAPGAYVTGFYGAVGAWTDALGVTCSDGSYRTVAGNVAMAKTPTDAPTKAPACPEGYSTLTASAGSYVDNIVGMCGNTPQRFGNNNPSTAKFACPAGEVLTGIDGFANKFVNTVRFTCAPKPAPLGAVPTFPALNAEPLAIPLATTSPTPSPTTTTSPTTTPSPSISPTTTSPPVPYTSPSAAPAQSEHKSQWNRRRSFLGGHWVALTATLTTILFTTLLILFFRAKS